MAVIPLSPVTQKPPEDDENDVPPIRIITNQTPSSGEAPGTPHVQPPFLLEILGGYNEDEEESEKEEAIEMEEDP
ncbi:hypothetical protein PUN28_007642 [Cardiocondyla obscurior]|uniref:Uncharacterized protein n=1 Tax=Cardiocondyla obscurior TaxID=286306 RepID=A0AAW2G4M9_9HYME